MQNRPQTGSVKPVRFSAILRFLVFFLLVLAAVAYPTDRALLFLGTTTDRLANLLIVFLTLSLTLTLLSKVRFSFGLVFFLLFVTTSILLRFFHLALVDFSGRGFGDEVFVHLSFESFRIAWHEYGRLFRRVGLLFIVSVAVCTALFFEWRKVRSDTPIDIPPLIKALFFSFCLIPLLLGRTYTPEWQFISALTDWQSVASNSPSRIFTEDSLLTSRFSDPAKSIELDEFKPWLESGLFSLPEITVDRLVTSTPNDPKNLVLLYVEALTTSIVEHPEYPDLMPGFRRLIEEHSLVNEFFASSLVTIEGVSNTQCGLLFPFQGHGGFAGRTMLAEALPCLGDVLAAAGYYQAYVLGGGPMSFTGKGEFLAAHGFNDLRGWEYWQARGFDRAPGHWGISDVETLAQVKKLVEEKQSSGTPFNITSLTVGSHIPGYSYPECTDFRDGSERYLNALHCADQIILEWITDLQNEGLLENTVLVVVGDHPVFSNPEMVRLFGSSVQDSRIPLIVLGDGIPISRSNSGAGYDLAPTILDLLEVSHNASFIMGRSLLRDQERPEYYFGRRFDIYKGDEVFPAEVPCRERQPGESGTLILPLSRCDKETLFQRTLELTQAYSVQPLPLNCSSERPIRVTAPKHPVGPISFIVNDRDLASRFSWRGRVAHPNDQGMFILSFSPLGRMEERIFLPDEIVRDASHGDVFEGLGPGGFMVIAWRSRNDPVDLSAIRQGLPSNQIGSGAWIVDKHSLSTVLSAQSVANSIVLEASLSQCNKLLVEEDAGL